MIKKIALGVVLAGLIGILITGGIIRTIDKTGNLAEARVADQHSGQGSMGESQAGSADAWFQGQGRGQGQGQGRSGGQGRGRDVGMGNAEPNPGPDEHVERQYPNSGEHSEQRVSIEGIVRQEPAPGVDLVLESNGEEIVVGTGPGYMEAQGFMLEEGEPITVQGFWEDGEFKASAVARLRDGKTITLRDADGRPAWAGQGRRAQGQQSSSMQESD